MDSTFNIFAQWVLLKFALLAQLASFINKRYICNFFAVSTPVETKKLLTASTNQEDEITSLDTVTTNKTTAVGADKQLTFLNYIAGLGARFVKDSDLEKLFDRDLARDTFGLNLTLIKNLFKTSAVVTLQDLSSAAHTLLPRVKGMLPQLPSSSTHAPVVLGKAKGLPTTDVPRLALESTLGSFVTRFDELERKSLCNHFNRNRLN